jgi:hypothetical protein
MAKKHRPLAILSQSKQIKMANHPKIAVNFERQRRHHQFLLFLATPHTHPLL